jgi:hypothetical protein
MTTKSTDKKSTIECDPVHFYSDPNHQQSRLREHYIIENVIGGNFRKIMYCEATYLSYSDDDKRYRQKSTIECNPVCFDSDPNYRPKNN